MGTNQDSNEIIKINATALIKTITVTLGQNNFLPSYAGNLLSVSTSTSSLFYVTWKIDMECFNHSWDYNFFNPMGKTLSIYPS